MKHIRRILCPLLLASATLLSSCIVETPPHSMNPADTTDTPESTAPSETKPEFVIDPSATSELEITAEPETTTEPETTAEPETSPIPPADAPRYLSFPLTDADDTASGVSLPDMTADAPKAIEFFILPTDTDAPALTSAWRWILPRDGDVNVQVVSYKDEKTYGFIVMQEGTSVTEANGIETRRVKMECASVDFFDDKASTGLGVYFHMDGGGSSSFQYTEQSRERTLITHRHNNLHALKQAEELMLTYNDPEKYEFTILYSYVDGVETVNTPVDTIPDFPFSLFNEYGFVD